jgi:hypothetical protein
VNLFRSPWEKGGQRRWLVMARQFEPSLASMSVASGAPPAKMKAPKGVSVFGEAPGALGLARVARNRCGIERGEARVPQLENRQIPWLGGSIYRGFWLPS